MLAPVLVTQVSAKLTLKVLSHNFKALEYVVTQGEKQTKRWKEHHCV